MKIVLKKADCLTDWYVIERAEHDGRTWFEKIGPHSSSFMMSSRIFPSYCVEGTSGEMIELARCVLSGKDCSFCRCAISFWKQDIDEVEIWSPRNTSNSRKGIITIEEAKEFARSVLDTLCPKDKEAVKYIPCIGIDNKLHVCEADSTTCKCGVKIKRKKLLKNDAINKFSCYECTY